MTTEFWRTRGSTISFLGNKWLALRSLNIYQKLKPERANNPAASSDARLSTYIITLGVYIGIMENKLETIINGHEGIAGIA